MNSITKLELYTNQRKSDNFLSEIPMFTNFNHFDCRIIFVMDRAIGMVPVIQGKII